MITTIARKITDILYGISKWTSLTVVCLIAFAISVDTILRYAFDRPVILIFEASSFSLLIIVAVGAAFALRENAHINIDPLTSKLSPKTAAWLRVVTDLVSIAVVAMLIKVTLGVSLRSFELGAVALSTIRTPLGPVQLLMPIGFTLLLIEFLRVFTNSLKSALRQS